MIYEFSIPYIVDTKNLTTVFLKKKYVTNDHALLLSKVNSDRTTFKDNVKNLVNSNSQESVDLILKDMHKYLETAPLLHHIFENNYSIKKNWKWTPIFTNTSVLKFSKSIFEGKSAEIVMTRYSYFASIFRQVGQEMEYVNKHFSYEEPINVNEFMTFSSKKRADPVVSQLEHHIKKAQNFHVEAWNFLNAAYKESSPQFQLLALSDHKYLEIRSAGMDIALNVTKMNANIMQVEFLRRNQHIGELGKYAKAIAIQAGVCESLITPFMGSCNPHLVDFIKISAKLFKALALWSLLIPIHDRMKSQKFEMGESFNQLGAVCVSISDYIESIMKEVTHNPKLKDSHFYRLYDTYYTQLIGPKCNEISKVYGSSFKYQSYDENRYNKIPELDFITEAGKITK